MRELVKALKVLSDETTLRALNLVYEQECCVCEVMQALDISQSKASRHLSALYDVGILKFRKDGLWSVYALDREGMPAYLAEIVSAARQTVANTQIATLDKKRLSEAKRLGPRCIHVSEKGSLPATE